MEWSNSNLQKVVAIGAVVSVCAIVLYVAFQSATEQVQVGVGLGLVVVAFVSSMFATRQRPAEQQHHHKVAHIPLAHHEHTQAA